MVRASERPFIFDNALIVKHTPGTVYLGEFNLLLSGQIRKNSGDAFSGHCLARTRRSYHKQVVHSADGNLTGSAQELLTVYFRKIHMIFSFPDIFPCVRNIFIRKSISRLLYEISHVLYRYNPDTFYYGCLPLVIFRDYHSLIALLPGHDGRREHTTHRKYGTV